MDREKNYHYFFRTLANPLRIHLLTELSRESRCVSELAEEMEEDRSRVSHALKNLLECNFVTVEKDGRKRVYSINKNTIQPLLEIADEHVRNNCKNCKHAVK